jgi:N6-adenosine-specific RNA methylase IME4
MNRELCNPPAIVRPAADLAALAAAANAECAAGDRSQEQALAHYRRAGEALLQAKAKIKHGQWMLWLEGNWEHGQRMANRCMAHAKVDAASNLRDQAAQLWGHASVDAEEASAAAKEAAGPFPAGKFGVLLADPPWLYEFAETNSRKIENHYPTLSAEEIAALEDSEGRKATDLPAEDCMLFCWTTSPKLREGLEVVEAWGFDYRTCMVWVKDRIGMGYYARQKHELLLIARRGEPAMPEPEDRPESVFEAPRGRRHSAKPECVYQTIEAMYPDVPKVELFSRTSRRGWASWGNDIQ